MKLHEDDLKRLCQFFEILIEIENSQEAFLTNSTTSEAQPQETV